MRSASPGPKINLNAITTTHDSQMWAVRRSRPKQMDNNNSSSNDALINNKGSPDDYRKFAITKYAYDFTENIGFQGIRYIFMKDGYWLRRSGHAFIIQYVIIVRLS